jgi:hypothetical protein
MQLTRCPSRDVPFGSSTSVSSVCGENLSRTLTRMFSGKFRKKSEFPEMQMLDFSKDRKSGVSANRRVYEKRSGVSEKKQNFRPWRTAGFPLADRRHTGPVPVGWKFQLY